MFSTYLNKGFHMTFENGWTISVQFGPNNYCDQEDTKDDPRHHAKWNSKTAEVAIWTCGLPIRLIGFYATADDVAEIIHKLSSDYAPLYYGA